MSNIIYAKSMLSNSLLPLLLFYYNTLLEVLSSNTVHQKAHIPKRTASN